MPLLRAAAETETRKRRPTTTTTTTSHWPEFPRAIGGFRYLYVAINKITKCPEATPMVKINKQSVVKFIKSIVYRFMALNKIITDNRSQFTSSAFHGYCEDLGIQICYAFVAHPESNG
jgi:transposase InsO family protein